MRSNWTTLPESVTAGIAERVGGTFDVVPAPGGDHAEIASTVTGPAGQVFVKAAQVGNMFRLWAEATKPCQQIAAAVLAFRAVLTRELSGLDSVALPALPDGGRYDHPLVDAKV